jgi:hypothetical protein
MVVIMQRTIEHVIELTKTPGIDPKRTASIAKLWQHVNPDTMRQTQDGIKYVKIEL